MKSDLPINSARISPDGRLIAYQSTESAESPKQGIYVRTLDLEAGKTGETAQQVKGDPSFGMGLAVSWRQDARELYYLAPKHAVMAVDVTASPTPALGTPRALFSVPDATNDAQGIGLWWGNVARDGQRVVYRWRQRARLHPPTRPFSSPSSTARAKCCGESGRSVATGSPHSHRTARASQPDGSIPSRRADDPTSGSWTLPRARPRRSPMTRRQTSRRCGRLTVSRSSTCPARAGGYQGIYRKAADGTGEAELIYRYSPGAPVNLRDISADGKHLLFNSGGVILVVPMAGDAQTRKAIELSREEFLVNGGVFSPDGKLIAFTSNETEAFELYLRPFDAATGAAAGDTKYRVSKDGAGALMVWRADGRELYFMDTEPDLKVMAVDVTTSPSVQTGAPKELFQVPGDAQGDLGTTRYISRDGQRFVFVLPAER